AAAKRIQNLRARLGPRQAHQGTGKLRIELALVWMETVRREFRVLTAGGFVPEPVFERSLPRPLGRPALRCHVVSEREGLQPWQHRPVRGEGEGPPGRSIGWGGQPPYLPGA